ncbi:hypothetical protein WHI96_20750 [Pseudonocardia tropica]|uniref:ABC-2 family transporter protein n=1 Tax=Pseudonocardia tropica TaxID=681289 RepID=A0ABV1JZ71_9PSEU
MTARAAAGVTATRTPTAAAVRTEFAKMRGLRTAPVLTAMVAGVVVLTCRELVSPGFAESVSDPSGTAWDRLLAASALAVRLLSPVGVAVVASRLVDPEHRGRGWLLSHTVGLPGGRLCRAKWLAGGALLTGATVGQSLAVLGVGRLAGVTADVPGTRWLTWTAAVLTVSLVLLAAHLVLGALVENQLVGIGVGVVGVFVAASAPALPGWAAVLTPWGHYALVTPVRYRDVHLVATDPPLFGTVAMAVVAAAVVVLVTHRLDRREV